MSEKEMLSKLAKATAEGDEALAKQVAENVIRANIGVKKAIEALAQTMAQLGDKYARFEVFLPELILASDAMKACIAIFRPKLMEKEAAKLLKGKVVIGTVFGDIHDLGKDLVSTFLSIAGYEVFDLGKDIPPRDFVAKAEEVGANIIGLSCLLTPSMYYQKDVIELLKDRRIREKYYVVVGGGPIIPEWVERIGADGYGKYAEDAVRLCDQLTEAGKTPGSAKPKIIGLSSDY